MIFGTCTDHYPRCPSTALKPHALAIPKDWINETVAQCQHRPARGHGPCGTYVYACRVVRAGEPRGCARGDVVWIVAAIDEETYYALKDYDGDWQHRLHASGTSLPGVELDLAPDESAPLPNVDIDLQEAG